MHANISYLARALNAWCTDAARRLHMREQLLGALQHWSSCMIGRAFGVWRDWALRRAALLRRAKGFVAILLGRSLAWAFYKLRWAVEQRVRVVG